MRIPFALVTLARGDAIGDGCPSTALPRLVSTTGERAAVPFARIHHGPHRQSPPAPPTGTPSPSSALVRRAAALPPCTPPPSSTTAAGRSAAAMARTPMARLATVACRGPAALPFGSFGGALESQSGCATMPSCESCRRHRRSWERSSVLEPRSVPGSAGACKRSRSSARGLAAMPERIATSTSSSSSTSSPSENEVRSSTWHGQRAFKATNTLSSLPSHTPRLRRASCAVGRSGSCERSTITACRSGAGLDRR